MFFDQFGAKAIMPCGHGRVRRKYGLARYEGDGLFKAEAFFGHARANRFENAEGAVAFVQVQYPRRDAHGLQRAIAADAQQQFLADAHPAVTAVKTRGEHAVFGRIAFDV